MQRITLAAFTEKHGQTGAAGLLGMTQGALAKALKVGREVYVTQLPDKTFQAEETRPFPSTKKTQAA